MFPTTVGSTMSATNLPSRHFKPLLKRAELPAIRLHDLRHTCASILLMAGKHPKYVQELLGHADISLTLNVYFPAQFGSVLVRLQYGCSTSALREGGVVE